MLVAASVGLAQPSAALTLGFPGPASETASRTETLGSYRLPVGPWSDGASQTRLAEGALTQTAWRIDTPGTTTLELLTPLRNQLIAAGFRVLFECETSACGGFDFRYSTDVLPEPEMHIDLGDFRFLSAERSVGVGSEFVSLMVSRSAETGFVQMIGIGEATPPQAELTASTKTPPNQPTPTKGIGERLEAGGSVALEDLTFDTGAGALGATEFASLIELAAYLTENPDRQVMLVGHTDASGGLAANVSLSRQRAASVRARLIEELGAPATQITADGVGFLVPRATNLTDEGRSQNRRVEAVLTSTR